MKPMTMINTIADRVETVVSDLVQRGNEWVQEAELDVRAKELAQKTERVVREHPVEALLVGAAVGFLIGRIFLRR